MDTRNFTEVVENSVVGDHLYDVESGAYFEIMDVQAKLDKRDLFWFYTTVKEKRIALHGDWFGEWKPVSRCYSS